MVALQYSFQLGGYYTWMVPAFKKLCTSRAVRTAPHFPLYDQHRLGVFQSTEYCPSSLQWVHLVMRDSPS
jgi:hypothetical protein